MVKTHALRINQFPRNLLQEQSASTPRERLQAAPDLGQEWEAGDATWVRAAEPGAKGIENLQA